MYITPHNQSGQKPLDYILSIAQEIKAKPSYPPNIQPLTQIAISSIQFMDDFSKRSEQLGKTFKQPTTTNAANIFRVKQGSNYEKKDKLTYIRYENYTSARSRKTTEQKIFQINNFVKKLTENINKEEEGPDISETKFKALKKIIEYYDIKNLDKSEYMNVIKSFGLQIGSMNTRIKNHSFSEEKKPDTKKFKQTSHFANQTQKKIQIRQLQQSNLSYRQRSTHSNFQGIAIVDLTKPKLRGDSQDKKLQSNGGDKSQLRSTLFSSLQMGKKSLKERSTKKQFKFNSLDNIIKEKINKFREFLFALNFSNRVYRDLNIDMYTNNLKYYVGSGNNGNLIRSLMKKRFSYEEVHNEKEANFIWTQIKMPNIFSIQAVVLQDLKTFQKKIGAKPIFNKFDPLLRILTSEQYKQINIIYDTMKNRQFTSFGQRIRLCHTRVLKQSSITQKDTIHNHLPGNGLLGNKKAMFFCMREYYTLIGQNVFDVVPLTFIINNGLLDPEYNTMAAYFNQKKMKKRPNFWILKPGQFSNRGNGIECTNKLEDIRKRVSKLTKEKKKRSLIVQQYMTRPLLYNGRKFDIRAYMIITYHNGKTKAYWYQDGYVRTSSHFFSLDEMADSYIHLTNDAVQKNSDNYGRFEEGNKLSYPQLQRYLETLPANGRNLNFYEAILPQMKTIAANAVKSTFINLNPERKNNNFQLFGFDFMIDDSFKPWLIEINTNPCLQLSSPVLQRIIPHMVQNTLRIVLDTVFPPPNNFSNNYKYNIPQNSLHYNKFEVIFDSDKEGRQLSQLYKDRKILRQLLQLEQEKNEYHEDGEMISLDDL